VPSFHYIVSSNYCPSWSLVEGPRKSLWGIWSI